MGGLGITVTLDDETGQELEESSLIKSKAIMMWPVLSAGLAYSSQFIHLNAGSINLINPFL